jgi:phage shock protein E
MIRLEKMLIPALAMLLLFIHIPSFGQAQEVPALPQAKFERKMKKKNAVLLDVRTRDEYTSGFIGDALNYNVLDSLSFIKQLSPLNKKKTYLLYCQSGRRSSKAMVIMKQQGFRKVYQLEGGISGWTGAIKKPE